MTICFDESLIGLKLIINKQAVTIYNAISDVLSRNELYPIVVVSDTEATNTDRKNGVIARLKKDYEQLEYQPCSLHILDLILKHEFQLVFLKSQHRPRFLTNLLRQ